MFCRGSVSRAGNPHRKKVGAAGRPTLVFRGWVLGLFFLLIGSGGRVTGIDPLPISASIHCLFASLLLCFSADSFSVTSSVSNRLLASIV